MRRANTVRVELIGYSILAVTWLLPPTGAARVDDTGLDDRARERAAAVREKVIELAERKGIRSRRRE